MRQAASLSLRETCVGVMVAGSQWSVISMAGSAIENAPRTSLEVPCLEHHYIIVGVSN